MYANPPPVFLTIKCTFFRYLFLLFGTKIGLLVLRRFTFLLGAFLLGTIVQADIPFAPRVINYAMADYKAGNQNWSVAQDQTGTMYFGNNQGLLQFDGINWRLYKLPNNNAVRSLYISDNQRIYVGSFEEFGYFEADEKNRLVYHSLKERVLGYTFSNDEIWTINEHKGNIYFQSFSSFFVYDGQTVKSLSGSAPLYFFSLFDTLYAQLMGGGFCRYENGRFIELVARNRLNDDHVVAVLPYDNELLLITATSGCFLYGKELKSLDNAVSHLLKGSIANRATMTKDSIYIIGTIANGVIAMSKQGDLLWHINRENRLINNTVLGVYMDLQNNLWTVLDNGIATIQMNAPVYVYEPSESQIGMVHDLAIKNQKMYLATNQGIYLSSKENLSPQLIPYSEEQTWYIENVDNQLMAGHNRGMLLIKDDQVETIAGWNDGGTALRKGVIFGKEVLLQMSYSSLSVFFKDSTGQWIFSHNVDGFSNLIKSFEIDLAGNIWASHMHKGLYRVSLDETLSKVNDIQYVGKLEPDSQEGKINVMKLRGRIILTDGQQFYTYEDLSNTIVPYQVLNESFPELGDTYRIVPLHNDMFWFVRDTEYALLSYEKGFFVLKQRFPFSIFRHPPIEGRGNVYVDTDGVSYFCLNGGIAMYSSGMAKGDSLKISLHLSSVKAYDRKNSKSYLLACRQPRTSSENIILDYQYNSILFELGYPDYSRFYTKVKYRLEGFDNKWQEDEAGLVKSYSDLPYGDYIFRAVVEDGAGEELSSLAYPFTIKRPFYQSIPAILIYFVLIGYLIFVLIKVCVRRIISNDNQQREKYRLQQEEQLRRQEQVITKLKNEKLEGELTYKSKELASATLSIIMYNEFLAGLKKNIQELHLSGNYSRKSFDQLIKRIDDSLTNEEEWKIYQINFDHIHENFFRKLKDHFPDLTPSDLRMCALLRLNMPTKDMARMLNLSIRGVEAARYRLRKKLDLPEGKGLADFMIGFN